MSDLSPLSGSSGSQTSGAQVRHLRISVPLVACLFDGQKYFSPDTPGRRRGAQAAVPASLGHRSPHHDAALAQDGGNARRAAVELAVEGRLRPAALAQHLADRNATGGSQGPGEDNAVNELLTNKVRD